MLLSAPVGAPVSVTVKVLVPTAEAAEVSAKVEVVEAPEAREEVEALQFADQPFGIAWLNVNEVAAQFASLLVMVTE